MSYLPPEYAVVGTPLAVQYFGERYPVTVAVAGSTPLFDPTNERTRSWGAAVNVLVCVKRVPATGGRMTLTPDSRDIDTKFLGFVVSPHEECAVEEAVRIIETHGGDIGRDDARARRPTDQLRDAMAVGIDRAVLLETDGSDWDPVATAAALVDAIRALEAAAGPFDLILFGNESADSGGFQVGIRVATALDRPIVTGAKGLEIGSGSVTARREAPGGWEMFEVPVPAVVAVREGINLPRYPSVPGRMRAKKKEIERVTPSKVPGGPELIRFVLPQEAEGHAEILGTGPDAAPRVVAMLREIGVL